MALSGDGNRLVFRRVIDCPNQAEQVSDIAAPHLDINRLEPMPLIRSFAGFPDRARLTSIVPGFGRRTMASFQVSAPRDAAIIWMAQRRQPGSC
jgi:hypothetical protein